MKRVHLPIAAAAAALALPLLAGPPPAPLSPACRAQIIRLCGTERSGRAACLAERRASLSADCRNELQARRQARRGAGTLATPLRTIPYGADERQQIDLYLPSAPSARPALVVYVHGGGWRIGNRRLVQEKPAHFTAKGYAFASIGYRLLPDHPVETQAADIGAALRTLRRDAAREGFDPDRIVLMGHSAGAHLAALVATDPAYAGDAFDAIAGVVLLDGAGYDIPATMQHADMEVPRLYRGAFGQDAARQRALSPVTHVGGKDAPDWLVLYAADRARSRTQSEDFAARLRRAGANAEATPIDTDHRRMNRELGTAAGAAQTQAVDAFLARILG